MVFKFFVKASSDQKDEQPKSQLHRAYGRARLDDRQINELLGIAQGLIADNTLNRDEVEFLGRWLTANYQLTENPLIGSLLTRVREMLSDGHMDSDESKELIETLKQFSGGNFEHGEQRKSNTLPFTQPAPLVTFPEKSFCLTGTFARGSRRDCEQELTKRGAVVAPLTKKTNYLVVGTYVTESWVTSTYGQKIQKAQGMVSKNIPISIIGEEHWVSFF